MRIIYGVGVGEQRVACPYCPCDNVHVVGVRTFPVHGCVAYETTHEGLRAQPSDAAQRQRGVSVVLRWVCEWGHMWEAELRFHKGSTWLTNVLITEAHTEAEHLDLPQVIWRD